MNIKTIVVNWHITESCNYKCKYCFAKWKHLKEIWTDPEKFNNRYENYATEEAKYCMEEFSL